MPLEPKLRSSVSDVYGNVVERYSDDTLFITLTSKRNRTCNRGCCELEPTPSRTEDEVEEWYRREVAV